MPRTIFRDFDEFADAINGIAGRFIPTARSETDWWVQVIPVGGVVVQQVQTGGPTAFVGDGKDHAITLGIPTTSPGQIHVDGSSLANNSFILVNEGQPFSAGAQRITRWAGLTVPLDHPSLPADLLHILQMRPSGRRSGTHTQSETRYVSATKNLLTRLFANDGSLVFREPAAVRAAEEELLTIASNAVAASNRSDYSGAGRPPLSRDRVLARALALIEASRGKPLFVQDLCRATQVSERTLRNIFHEYFGVGPMRLLKVNQLREIRAALIAADPDGERVWKIAARFGVWDLSLFARNYKMLFDEKPIETLRRTTPPRRRGDPVNPTWIRYASKKFAESSSVHRR